MNKNELIRFSVFLFLLFLCSCNRCWYGCLNGVCLNKQCECDLFWEGDACERSTLSKFEGSYTSDDSCFPNTKDVQLTMTIIPSEPGKMQLSNGMIIDFDDSSRFVLNSQEFQGKMVHGEGQMLVNYASITYQWKDSVNGSTCLISCKKVNK